MFWDTTLKNLNNQLNGRCIMKSKSKWVGIIVLGVMLIGMQAFVVKDVKAESAVPDLDKDYVFTPVEPCRIVDSRLAGGAFGPGERRDFNVYGSVASQGGAADCPSPKGEPRGVHINVTVVPMSGKGNFGVFPANVSPKLASLINYVAGVQNIANAASVKTYYSIGSDEIGVINRNGTAHLIIDVMGYYYEKPGGGSIHVYDANDQFLGILIDYPAMIIIHSLNLFTYINTSSSQPGEIGRSSMEVYFEQPYCVYAPDTTYIRGSNSPQTLRAYLDGSNPRYFYSITLEENILIGIASKLKNGECLEGSYGESSSGTKAVEILEADIPFTLPVALPLRYELQSP
jgi:hypothetical protein